MDGARGPQEHDSKDEIAVGQHTKVISKSKQTTHQMILTLNVGVNNALSMLAHARNRKSAAIKQQGQTAGPLQLEGKDGCLVHLGLGFKLI